MKKTLTINLNGRVFNIDEDAYQLLDDYLKNLRIYFRKEEGCDEILADFEARIEELLNSRIRLGYNVINIEEVEKVISQMGRPDEFGDRESEINTDKDQKTEVPFEPVRKKLYRDTGEGMIGGVFSGIGAYFNCNVLALRLLAVLLVFLTSLAIIPIYLIAWLIIPEARTAEQKLEMRGIPITVENIGKTVAAESETQKSEENQGCIGSFLEIVVALFKICLIGIGIIIGIPVLFALFIIILVLFAVVFGVGTGLLSSLFSWGGIPMPAINSLIEDPLLATISLAFLLGVPLVVLIYSIVSYAMKLKPVHKGVKWTGFIVWVIALILFFASGGRAEWKNFFSELNRNKNSSVTEIIMEGNGILKDKSQSFSALINTIQLNNLEATVQVEQIKGDRVSVWMNGDENLVDKIEVDYISEGKLKIRKSTSTTFAPSMPLFIHIKTPGISKLDVESVDNINIVNAFHSDDLYLKMRKVENLIVDSLEIGKLNVKMRDMGTVILAGHAKNITFDLKNAEEINLEQLKVDQSSVKVSGVKNFKGTIVKQLSIKEGTSVNIKELVTEPEEKQEKEI